MFLPRRCLLSASLLFVTSLGHAQGAPAGPPPFPSTLLSPGVQSLGRGLESVRVDRWKLPQAGREEVQANLGSVHRDLESTLPGLLATADAAPGSVTGMLPVSRNVTALYDVLLRIVERAKVSAPSDQLAALEQARSALDQARRNFDDNLQAVAGAQEASLQRLQTQLSAPPPAPPPAPAVAVPRKKKARTKSQN